MAEEPYQPIACAFHDSLEFAVLRRMRLRLKFKTATGIQEAIILPTDVATRDSAEWLSYLDESGVEQVIRLDRVISATPYH